MLSFSRTTGYAILALGCIGNGEGQRVLSTQIQTCTGVPMPYLRKTLLTLARCGLIQAKRGHHGGFVLSRPAAEITLLDVVQAVEHSKPADDCLLALPGCSDETPCPLRGLGRELRSQLEAALRRITVAHATESIRAARGRQMATCQCLGPQLDQAVPATAEQAESAKNARRADGNG